MSQPVTDGERANWAVAAASQRITKRLRPAIRSAYSLETRGAVNAAALPEAIAAAEEVLSALRAARELTDEG